MSEAERIVSGMLVPGWVWNLAIPTKKLGDPSLPSAYKPDFAWPNKMICLEVDGVSHKADKTRLADVKKTAALNALGWKVYRISNAQATHLYGTLKSKTPIPFSFPGFLFTTARS